MKIRKRYIVAEMVAIIAAINTACSHNLYDEDKHEELVIKMQPVDTIDAYHNWQLAKSYTITFDASKTNVGSKSIQILSANPVAGHSANILGQHHFTDGEKRTITFTAPTNISEFYAALIDANEAYTIVQFTPDSRTVDFTNPIATKAIVNQRLLTLQSYCYCFEEEIPEPGDYDYNDIVLRISQERTAPKQITLNVTLAAVGTQRKIAAAIQLINFHYNDIDSVVTKDGTTFDDGYVKTFPKMIEGEELLLQGFKGEALINLFEDCHWATKEAIMGPTGMLERHHYNVSKNTSTDLNFEIISPRTISYIITFKDAASLDRFSLASIDPFIITEYNGAFWETHANINRVGDQLLHRYTPSTNMKILPWALTIPNSGFRYPLEGVNMGFYKKGILFGAYMTKGHSFGEWASNRRIAQDWYEYPTNNQVF